MARKHFSAIALSILMAQPAAANDLIGGVIGGIIGGAIANEANKKKAPRRVYSGVSASVRQERRDIQTSLNYFGYPAGTPDGVLGKRSRAAIASYQAFLGYPATGRLTEFEKNILIGAYHQAIAGGPDTNRLIARDANGVKAVLIAQRDNLTGGPQKVASRSGGYAGLPYEVSVAVDEIADSSDPSAEQLLQRSGFIQLTDLNGDGNNDYILDTSFAGSSFWCNATQCKTLVFASSATGYVRNDLLLHNPTAASFECIGPNCRVNQNQTQLANTPTEAPATTLATAPAFPTIPLFNTEETTASLTTHCSKVNLLTNANGGFTTSATLSDADFALTEQLCLARTYAIAEGDAMIAKVSGVSSAQIEQQCQGLGATMKEHVSALSLKDNDAVIRDISAFVLQSGMPPAQLASTAKICLATGYRTDDLETALASGLLMVALGNRPYAELIGHHLSQGFGASVRKDLAVSWYGVALDALATGATPVFATTQPERTDLIQQATVMLSGGNVSTSQEPVTNALPVFTVTK